MLRQLFSLRATAISMICYADMLPLRIPRCCRYYALRHTPLSPLYAMPRRRRHYIDTLIAAFLPLFRRYSIRRCFDIRAITPYVYMRRCWRYAACRRRWLPYDFRAACRFTLVFYADAPPCATCYAFRYYATPRYAATPCRCLRRLLPLMMLRQRYIIDYAIFSPRPLPRCLYAADADVISPLCCAADAAMLPRYALMPLRPPFFAAAAFSAMLMPMLRHLPLPPMLPHTIRCHFSLLIARFLITP